MIEDMSSAMEFSPDSVERTRNKIKRKQYPVIRLRRYDTENEDVSKY